MKRYLIVLGLLVGIAAIYGVTQLSVVPLASGTYDDAFEQLSDAGFSIEAVDASGTPVEPHGLARITGQHPAAGSIRTFGSAVTVTTTPPVDYVVVPDVVGQQVSDAVDVVYDAGLMLATGGHYTDGEITTITPGPGQRVKFGSQVFYQLADGQ